ncbi:MAG: hypothetical protein WBO77_00650 [Microgenomates group bacterium]
MAETLSTEALNTASHDLLRGIPRFHGRFLNAYEGTLNGGWQRLGEVGDRKMTATHSELNIFGKAFPETGLVYLQHTNQALQALARTSLSRPFLQPIHTYTHTEGGVLLFPLGVATTEQPRIEEFYSPVDIQRITEVAEDHGLTPIAPRGRIAVIQVGELAYATDVFDDSPHEITLFKEAHI